MPTRRTFNGELLRQKRTASGYNQRALAQALQVDYTTVSHWEIGRRSPKALTLLQLAEVLNCQVGDLFEAVAE
ncbi:helix-turn-helix domain-containing protein [Micromonospora inaquosa]|uniref:HTH cro/C1-type domain-containing protein n=1 Tax=Micromonospora inaquosa TaxID=2203716 RepID=A0A3N9X7Y7_9ACTN|nr:helix-turn-helix transcriptional regulator [Micromonospora inaquosa]RQX09072.1 hypothetical protein DLJ59_01190 [Micromonospora inaquosa]